MSRELDIPDFMRNKNDFDYNAIPLRQAVKRTMPEYQEYSRIQKFFKKTMAVGGILLVLSSAYVCMNQMEKSRANDIRKSTIEMVKDANAIHGVDNNIQIIINDIQPVIDDTASKMKIENIADKEIAKQFLTKEAIDEITYDNQANFQEELLSKNAISNSEIQQHAVNKVLASKAKIHEITQNDGEKIIVDEDGFPVEIDT